MNNRALIWDIPTRIFHWALVAGFLAAFAIAQLSGKHEPLFPYHALLGLVLAFMVLLRLVWGWVGTRYARFGSFLFGPKAVVGYFQNLLHNGGERHVGHNPASSYAIFVMLFLVLMIAASGWLMSRGNEAFEEVHSAAGYALLAVAGVHVLGVIVHTIRYRENITLSMITGKKEAEAGAAITSSQIVAGIVMTAVVVALAIGLYRNYDAQKRSTRLPFFGQIIQLGENESGGDHGPARNERAGHDED